MDSLQFEIELRQLINEYRNRCLWFLREDFYPETLAEQERVLTLIARNGDLDAFKRVGRLRTWLSQPCNATSAAS